MKSLKRAIAIFCIGLLAISILPLASATTDTTFKFEMTDYKTIKMSTDVELAKNGSSYRKIFDQYYGNNDGILNQTEVDKIIEMMKNVTGRPPFVIGDNLTIDGKSPYNWTWDLTMNGLLGSVNNTGPISMTVSYIITYNVSEANKHTIVFKGSTTKNTANTTMEFYPPNNWKIESATTGTINTEKTKLTYIAKINETTPTNTIVITKEGQTTREGKGFIPFFELPLLIGLLIVSAIVLRRRK